MRTELSGILKRYPRLSAHIICQSLGYFTPKGASNVIYAYKNDVPYSCEYISHISGGFDREEMKKATKFVIRDAIKKRHLHKGFMEDYNTAKALVGEVIQSGQKNGVLASWF